MLLRGGTGYGNSGCSGGRRIAFAIKQRGAFGEVRGGIGGNQEG